MVVAPGLFVDTIRVCLFGDKIRWMENFGEKIGRKTFLSVFGWALGWRGRKINGEGMRPKCFLPRLTKKFSLKWREN